MITFPLGPLVPSQADIQAITGHYSAIKMEDSKVVATIIEKIVRLPCMLKIFGEVFVARYVQGLLDTDAFIHLISDVCPKLFLLHLILF
jgi:hypothetical protein